MDESLFSDARFFQLITQASPAGMVIVDDAGKIALVNLQAEKIFGYSQQELLGQPVETLIPKAHHHDHLSHRARYLAHPEPRSMAEGRDLFARRKDGSEVSVDISLHPIETEQGRFILAHVMDATLRRQAARQRESQQAIERLAMMGQLAGSVAHEIRTPLCVIRNNIYFLRTIAEQLDAEAIECLTEIDDAVGKAERIVSELLDFTRGNGSELTAVATADLFDPSLQELAAKSNVRLVSPERDSPLQVDADQDQIQRVLANLVGNAVDATGPGGTVTIRVGYDVHEVWIDVMDDGPGVAEDDRERIFEALFTTKPSGIGLGLTLSRRYAENNGGSLQLRDHPAGGACFRLTLRRTKEKSTESSPS